MQKLFIDLLTLLLICKFMPIHVAINQHYILTSGGPSMVKISYMGIYTVENVWIFYLIKSGRIQPKQMIFA